MLYNTNMSIADSRKPSVIVLGGGISPERAVSLRSSRAVYEALVEAGYNASYYDVTDLALVQNAVKGFDVALPILHGKGGEDGQIQSLLEQAGIPFLGSGTEASKLCMDKVRTKEVLTGSGVRVPHGEVVTIDTVDAFVAKYPHYVLKPIDGGSSIDTIINGNASDMLVEARAVCEKYGSVLAEEYIAGTEVTVPIIDGLTLPPILIIPPKGKTFDYENKYNGQTQELCPIPEDVVSRNAQTDLQLLGQRVHGILGARHVSRADMIIDGSGLVYVLELNTIPGMTNQSLVPGAAAATGMPMPALVDHLVKIAYSQEAK
jgi:D-alanine-D-alanine ligase